MLQTFKNVALKRLLQKFANNQVNQCCACHTNAAVLQLRQRRRLTTDTIKNKESIADDADEKETKEINDKFTEEFLKNRIELTTLQKLILSAGSSLAALADPRRHDMIACLGETTGEATLDQILQTMRTSEEGERILKERPRINTATVNLDELRKLPENTFGHAYVKFLEQNNVTPDSRMEVRFMSDADLAYIMTRYRECHDLVHTILDMPTNMLGEVAVKWVEALNNGLPMCYGGAIFGAFRLRPKQRKEYMKRYLPWAIQNGRAMKPLMNVYWEERWGQPIKDLRKELNIKTLN